MQTTMCFKLASKAAAPRNQLLAVQTSVHARHYRANLELDCFGDIARSFLKHWKQTLENGVTKI